MGWRWALSCRPVMAQRSNTILEKVPARRWAELDEVAQALLFLLDGPAYLTGDILYLDGGRHLV